MMDAEGEGERDGQKDAGKGRKMAVGEEEHWRRSGR